MILVWVTLSLIVGIMGNKREIGFIGAFIISLIFSPLIGGIITSFSKIQDQEAYLANLLLDQHAQAWQELRNHHTPFLADELERLKGFREQGVLTEEEYQSAKRKAVGLA